MRPILTTICLLLQWYRQRKATDARCVVQPTQIGSNLSLRLNFPPILLKGVAATMILLPFGCSEQTTQHTVRSDYYTRGIGQYPGSPQEDFSPELQPNSTYRNIALLRAAYQSSSYDYNLTAQLVTDGIISTQPPQYLILSTPDGEKPRREREWMIDEGPYSRNTAVGEDTYFQFTLQNYSKKADKVHLRGSVTYQADKAGKGYELICLGSDNGSRYGTTSEPWFPNDVGLWNTSEAVCRSWDSPAGQKGRNGQEPVGGAFRK